MLLPFFKYILKVHVCDRMKHKNFARVEWKLLLQDFAKHENIFLTTKFGFRDIYKMSSHNFLKVIASIKIAFHFLTLPIPNKRLDVTSSQVDVTSRLRSSLYSLEGIWKI